MVAQLFTRTTDRLSALTDVAALHAPADAMIRGIYTGRVAWAARRTPGCCLPVDTVLPA